MITYGVILIILLLIIGVYTMYIYRTPRAISEHLEEMKNKITSKWINYTYMVSILFADILFVIYIFITLING